MELLLAQANAALEAVTQADFPAQWSAIARELDVATEKLGVAWGAVSHLKSVADTPELRAAYNAALPQITEFWTWLALTNACTPNTKRLTPTPSTPSNTRPTKTPYATLCWVAQNSICTARERFAAIQEEQATLGQKFSENTLDATDAFSYYATEAEMDGVPGTTCAKRPAIPHRVKTKTVTNSASKCPAICRSCSLRTAAPCAPRCTAPT